MEASVYTIVLSPKCGEWFAVYHLVGIDGLSDVPDACEEPSRYHQNEEASVMPVAISGTYPERLSTGSRRGPAATTAAFRPSSKASSR